MPSTKWIVAVGLSSIIVMTSILGCSDSSPVDSGAVDRDAVSQIEATLAADPSTVEPTFPPTVTPKPSPASESNRSVSHANTDVEEIRFNDSRNMALFDNPPMGGVEWLVPPAVVSPGELVAEGVLEPGLSLFNPQEGEGSAFSVFYKGHREAMVELLPDLGPSATWRTFSTVASTDITMEGAHFQFRAYSPLLMDVGAGDLELRVYGVDADGNDVLIAVQDIGLGPR